jgi:hypothetical protein
MKPSRLLAFRGANWLGAVFATMLALSPFFAAVPAAHAESLMVTLIDGILDSVTGHPVQGAPAEVEQRTEVVTTTPPPRVVTETVVQSAPPAPSVTYTYADSPPPPPGVTYTYVDSPPPPPRVTYTYVETPPPTVVYAAPPAPVVVLGAAITGLAIGSLFWAAGHHHHHGGHYYGWHGGGYRHGPYPRYNRPVHPHSRPYHYRRW